MRLPKAVRAWLRACSHLQRAAFRSSCRRTAIRSAARRCSADTGKKTLSTRIVAYTIEAKLDATKHTIDCHRDAYLPQPDRKAAADFSLPSVSQRLPATIHIYDRSAPFRDARQRAGHSVGSETFRLDHRGKARSRRRRRPDRPRWNSSSRTTTTPKIAPSFRSPCRNPFAPGASVQFRMTFHDSSRKSSSAPATSTTSIWSANGSRKSACGGKTPGTATSSTPIPNSSRTSALST